MHTEGYMSCLTNTVVFKISFSLDLICILLSNSMATNAIIQFGTMPSSVHCVIEEFSKIYWITHQIPIKEDKAG